jgi:hypothetical protein
MPQADVVRDGVSAFEVYLEKDGAEVLRRRGYSWKVQPGRTPVWRDIVTFSSSQPDIEVDTVPVQHVRNLRHTLTHLRGELRTPQQREQFGQNSESGFPSYRDAVSTLTTPPPATTCGPGPHRTTAASAIRPAGPRLVRSRSHSAAMTLRSRNVVQYGETYGLLLDASSGKPLPGFDRLEGGELGPGGRPPPPAAWPRARLANREDRNESPPTW